MVCCMLLLYDIMTLLLCDIMTSWPPSSRPAPVTPSTRVPLGSRNDSCRRRGGRTLSISRAPCLLPNSLYTRCPSFQFDNIVYSVHFLIYWVAYYPGGPWYIGQKTGRERLPNVFLKTHKKKKTSMERLSSTAFFWTDSIFDSPSRYWDTTHWRGWFGLVSGLFTMGLRDITSTCTHQIICTG